MCNEPETANKPDITEEKPGSITHMITQRCTIPVITCQEHNHKTKTQVFVPFLLNKLAKHFFTSLI